MGMLEGEIEEIGCDWFVWAGKCWCLFLMVVIFQVLCDDCGEFVFEDLKKIVMVVECFYKVLLIYDDKTHKFIF